MSSILLLMTTDQMSTHSRSSQDATHVEGVRSVCKVEVLLMLMVTPHAVPAGKPQRRWHAETVAATQGGGSVELPSDNEAELERQHEELLQQVLFAPVSADKTAPMAQTSNNMDAPGEH